MTLSNEADSSSANDLSAEVDATLAGQGETQAETPAATGDQPEKTLLEHVQSVLKPETQEEAPPATAQSEETGTKDAEQPAESEPDDSKLPFHNHPRWKEVMGQRNEARKEAQEFKRQLEALEPVKADAAHHQNLVAYMRENQLTSEEANTGFEIMAAMKNDPLRALELLRPHLTALQTFAGDILPADLAAKVESGEVEEATARELARTRHAAEFEKSRRQGMERGQEEARQRQAQQERQNASDRMTQALLGWEQQVKTSDPDWAKKEDMVIAAVQAENISRPPRNEAEALENAQRAYARVNQTVSKFAAPRTPTPRTASSHDSVNGAKPAPKTALEAARMAVERR